MLKRYPTAPSKLIMATAMVLVSWAAVAQQAAGPGSFWLDMYKTADTPQKRLAIVRQMTEETQSPESVAPEIWDELLRDLFPRWNNLPSGQDRFSVERALRLVLAEIRQNGETERERTVLLLARQARETHLKSEAILTIGSIGYGEGSEYVAEELARILRAPQQDRLADEVVAHACIVTLAQFRNQHSIAALSEASSETVWLPNYLRKAAKEALQVVLTSGS